VRDRGAVEAESLRRLPEVTAHHVLELVEVHDAATQQWTEAHDLFPAAPGPSRPSVGYDEAALV
jgi:hypothetical protein